MFGLKIPQSIFVQADGFLRAATPKSDPPNPYDMIALVTNSAIASELYLKCLIHVESGQLVNNQHNLKKLFAMLPSETRATIQQRFDAIIMSQPDYDYSALPEEEREKFRAMAETIPKSLIEALRKGAESFVEWRYLYENEKETDNPFSLFPLPTILRNVILERKPEWSRFAFRLERMAKAQPRS